MLAGNDFLWLGGKGVIGEVIKQRFFKAWNLFEWNTYVSGTEDGVLKGIIIMLKLRIAAQQRLANGSLIYLQPVIMKYLPAYLLDMLQISR